MDIQNFLSILTQVPTLKGSNGNLLANSAPVETALSTLSGDIIDYNKNPTASNKAQLMGGEQALMTAMSAAAATAGEMAAMSSQIAALNQSLNPSLSGSAGGAQGQGTGV